MVKYINTTQHTVISATNWIVQDPRRLGILVGATAFTVTALAAILGIGGDFALVAGPVGGGSGSG